MNKMLPRTVDAVNISSSPQTLRDAALYASGGSLVMQPGVVYSLPREAFLRNWRKPWIRRAEREVVEPTPEPESQAEEERWDFLYRGGKKARLISVNQEAGSITFQLEGEDWTHTVKLATWEKYAVPIPAPDPDDEKESSEQLEDPDAS